jgi:hypothetical protein
MDPKTDGPQIVEPHGYGAGVEHISASGASACTPRDDARQQLTRVLAELHALDMDTVDAEGGGRGGRRGDGDNHSDENNDKTYEDGHADGQMPASALFRLEQLAARAAALRRHACAVDSARTRELATSELANSILLGAAAAQTPGSREGAREGYVGGDKHPRPATEERENIAAQEQELTGDPEQAALLDSVQRNTCAEIEAGMLTSLADRLDRHMLAADARITAMFVDGDRVSPARDLHLRVLDEDRAIQFLIKAKSAVLVRAVDRLATEASCSAEQAFVRTDNNSSTLPAAWDRTAIQEVVLPLCELMVRRVQSCLEQASSAISRMDASPRHLFDYAFDQAWIRDAEFDARYTKLVAHLQSQHKAAVRRFMELQHEKLRLATLVDRVGACDRLLHVLACLDEAKSNLLGLDISEDGLLRLLRPAVVALTVASSYETRRGQQLGEERRDANRQLVLAAKRNDNLADLAKQSVVQEVKALNELADISCERLAESRHVEDQLNAILASPAALSVTELEHRLSSMKRKMVGLAFSWC